MFHTFKTSLKLINIVLERLLNVFENVKNGRKKQGLQCCKLQNAASSIFYSICILSVLSMTDNLFYKTLEDEKQINLFR